MRPGGEARPLGPRFAALLAASASSNLADGVVKTALPLLAVRWTDSPVLVSAVVAASTLPWLLLALPAGLLADVVDRRRAMIVADVARVVVLASVAAAVLAGAGSAWLLVAAAFLLGCAETVHDTAAQSLLPGVVDGVDLERANGRLSAAEVTTNTFVGPPLGGFLVASAVVLGLVGPAALWLLAAVALLVVRARPAPRDSGRRPWARELVDGVRFVWSHSLLRAMALMVGFVNLATSAFLATFVVYAVGPTSVLRTSEVGYGLLLSVAGVGSLLGALGAARLAARVGRGSLLAATLLAMAVFVAAPGVVATTPPLVATFVLGGAAVSAWNVVTISFRQRVTPDHLLGRVNSFYRLLTWGTIPVGALLGGTLGALIGLQPLFLVAGVVAVLPLVGLGVVHEASMRRAEAPDAA